MPHHLFNISDTKQNGMNATDVSVTYGTVVRIECIKWYIAMSGALEWRCGDSETWEPSSRIIQANNNGNLPLCRPACGIKNYFVLENLLESHITGGRPSRIGEWPWMAFVDLDLRGPELSTSYCGGSLVGDRHIVTAAHCMGEIQTEDLRVYLGVTNRTNTTNPNKQ
uniref:Peptidase S1 domain-containing protein n=3 Tax=Ciona intestinalis TaxID=7719 RepID=F6R9Z3_CIOIN